MSRTPKGRPLSRSEIAALASLAGLVVVGLAAQGLSPMRVLMCLGFGAGFILIAWLWQVTLRRQAPARRDSTAGGWWLTLAVFLGLAAALSAIAWAVRVGVLR